MELRTIEWKNDSVVMIDQTKLPNEKLPHGQVGEPVTPEIKTNTAELDLDKDPNLGTSDLKKP